MQTLIFNPDHDMCIFTVLDNSQDHVLVLFASAKQKHYFSLVCEILQKTLDMHIDMQCIDIHLVLFNLFKYASEIKLRLVFLKPIY